MAFAPGIFVSNQRHIGNILAQVTIQEQERDELVITEHPVEQGAPIHDHAFKRGSEVTIKAGWSAAWAGDLSATGDGVYGWLLALQASLIPFDLHTGKRVYHHMLVQGLTITTDNASEFALMADIACRQVTIVRTSTAKVATSSDPANQKDPEKTAGKEKNGEKQSRNVGTGSGDIDHSAEATRNEYYDLQGSTNQSVDDLGLPSPTTTPEATKVEAEVVKNSPDMPKVDVSRPGAKVFD